ncbi:MAG: hypothetical protein NTW86_17150 [Candidatus Sumerlaeota bacterium]|nr:hypothetical protein [Candidatus Sumerlaeota bacterium]
MRTIVEMEQPARAALGARRTYFWKPAFAAALLLIVAGAAGLSIFMKNGSQAYALEQTIEANRHLRFIHMRFEPVGFGQASDMRAQFDDQGNMLQLRIDFPDTEDGPKITLWQEGKAEVWLQKKNMAVVVREPDVLQKIKMSVDDFDPRRVVENLYKAQAEGKVSIEIRGAKDQLINLIVTAKDHPALREVYQVDKRTNFVIQADRTKEKDGKEELMGRVVYLDYNDPNGPETLALAIPADAVRFDQVTHQTGLPKGDLIDQEIAAKVAREFFEALIAGDYDKAGQLLEGASPDFLRNMIEGKMKFVRIVSIGEPHPHAIPETHGWQTPCQIEMEAGGQTFTKSFELGVRPVYNQPDRWDVFGGF